MRVKKLIQGEKGSVTVLVAAAMVALAGLVALVTDAGLLYLNQTKISHALDSAVLAGVQELPEHIDLAIEVAYEYAEDNGIGPEEATFSLDTETYTLTGQATRNVNLFFARLLGFENADVSATSKARITSISEVEGVVPLGVVAQQYEYGQEIVLKAGTTDNMYPGWFSALSLGATGADAYRNNLANGYSGVIRIGQNVNFESGNMPVPTRQGLQERISKCNHIPQCSIYSYQLDCPRIVIIPLLKIEGTNPSSGEVVGFGAFFIDDYVGSATESQVKGFFLRYVVPGKADGSLNTDYGVYSAQLCR